MAITTQTVKVDLNTGKVLPVVYAHQNDTNRAIQFEVYNNGVPFPLNAYTVKFGYVSPKKHGQYTTINGDGMASGVVNGNMVSLTLPEEYTRISGTGLLTMIVGGGNTTIRPVNIKFEIQSSSDGADVISGSSDLPDELQRIADAWYDENIAEWLNENLGSVFTPEQFSEAVGEWMGDHTDAEWWVDENHGLHLSNVPPDADDRIGIAVDTWLDDHPEATTTVVDDSLTTAKFSPALRQKIDSKARYIFPRNFGYARNDGDCNLIVVDGVTILIDTHDDAAWSEVNTYLSDNNISHIDYFIISHYHADHVDNVDNLIASDYIDSETVVYAAPVGEFMHRMTGDMTDRANATIASLEQAGITPIFPSEFDYFYPVPTMKISFYNCDASVFNDSSWSDIYNECSMICLVEHGRNAVLYTGDAYQRGMRRALESGFLNRTVDLYKINHHGIQTNDSTYKNLSRINPTYAVQPSSMGMDRRNTHNQNVERQVLQMLGCKIFQCHSNVDDIVFESDVNSIVPVKGLASIYGGNYSQDQRYYVDISCTDDYQDGSEEHPFHELSQAISSVCLPYSPIEYTFYLADGTYNNSHETAERNRIKLHGANIVLRSISEDASKVIIKNGFVLQSCVGSMYDITFDCSTYYNEFYDSNMSLIRVVHDGNQGIANRQLSIYRGSQIRLTDCVFSNFLNAIRISAGGRMVYAGCTFDTGELAITVADGGFIKETYPLSNTFTNVTTQISMTDYADFIGGGEYRYVGSNTTQTYTGRKRRAGLIAIASNANINLYFYYVNASGVLTVSNIEEQITSTPVTFTISGSTVTFTCSNAVMMFVREF